jgi:hypothetical protein
MRSLQLSALSYQPTAYAAEMKRCQIVLFLRAVLAERGSMRAGAKILGVHRNTVRRVLQGAGYAPERLRAMARDRRKAIASEQLSVVSGQDRRIA